MEKQIKPTRSTLKTCHNIVRDVTGASVRVFSDPRKNGYRAKYWRLQTTEDERKLISDRLVESGVSFDVVDDYVYSPNVYRGNNDVVSTVIHNIK
jgi:hypothetical protein